MYLGGGTSYGEATITGQNIFAHRRTLSEIKHTATASEKHRVYIELLGPLTATDQQIKRRLTIPGSSPSGILQQSIRAGTASVHAVRLCLNAQYMEVRQAPRSSQREIVRTQDKIASIAIHHLLSDITIWGPFAMNCTEVQFQLCYFAIAEAVEDAISDWMFGDFPTQQVTSHVWRGSLLRCLLSAHSAYDKDENMDAGIQCFLNARARWDRLWVEAKARQLPRPPVPSLFPATVQLSRTLTDGFGRNTNPALFDKLIKVFAEPETHDFTKRTKAEMDYDIAYLLLFHPTYPKHATALALLQEFAAGNLDALPERITTPKANATSSGSCSVRLMY